MDLNFDGLMIETHPNPDEAWSDAAQQITPAVLKILIDKLILRSNQIGDSLWSEMEGFRTKINILDDRLFEILSARMKVSEELGIFKRQNNITILQENHWKKIIASRLEKVEEMYLTPKFVRSIMDDIHQESIRHQTRVMNPDLLK
jgi:chorismate mutase